MRSGSWLQAKQRYLGKRDIPEYKRALSRRPPTNSSKVAGKSSKPNGASPSPPAGVPTEPSDNGSYNFCSAAQLATRNMQRATGPAGHNLDSLPGEFSELPEATQAQGERLQDAKQYGGYKWQSVRVHTGYYGRVTWAYCSVSHARPSSANWKFNKTNLHGSVDMGLDNGERDPTNKNLGNRQKKNQSVGWDDDDWSRDSRFAVTPEICLRILQGFHRFLLSSKDGCRTCTCLRLRALAGGGYPTVTPSSTCPQLTLTPSVISSRVEDEMHLPTFDPVSSSPDRTSTDYAQMSFWTFVLEQDTAVMKYRRYKSSTIYLHTTSNPKVHEDSPLHGYTFEFAQPGYPIRLGSLHPAQLSSKSPSQAARDLTNYPVRAPSHQTRRAVPTSPACLIVRPVSMQMQGQFGPNITADACNCNFPSLGWKGGEQALSTDDVELNLPSRRMDWETYVQEEESGSRNLTNPHQTSSPSLVVSGSSTNAGCIVGGGTCNIFSHSHPRHAERTGLDPFSFGFLLALRIHLSIYLSDRDLPYSLGMPHRTGRRRAYGFLSFKRTDGRTAKQITSELSGPDPRTEYRPDRSRNRHDAHRSCIQEAQAGLKPLLFSAAHCSPASANAAERRKAFEIETACQTHSKMTPCQSLATLSLTAPSLDKQCNRLAPTWLTVRSVCVSLMSLSAARVLVKIGAIVNNKRVACQRAPPLLFSLRCASVNFVFEFDIVSVCTPETTTGTNFRSRVALDRIKKAHMPVRRAVERDVE
ncbi:uncharacterized protein CLUP02_06368 [Colletotrichum lupini]|uniref:Uncharacterized protein n=1 Tax=Colletotrichum lupini TaxID=145971 RepID=A0A9Q8SPH5_9PEZI|nr:uncharacterized protein CLUP02_06368 [Colletotrichum lupini]UQC80883.1 hypothetical protein CLUP02_06368 [Colletotrichum lupini]